MSHTRNFSNRIQLRRALHVTPEQAVLWFGTEMSPIIYLGCLFPNNSDSVSRRLWSSGKCELTSRRSLNGIVLFCYSFLGHKQLLPYTPPVIHSFIHTHPCHNWLGAEVTLKAQAIQNFPPSLLSSISVTVTPK